ncbi:MipA/OmpV family protein [Falsiroseomonas oryzae]|uniref:MipA/OmpV family protein n=1 Tax=Falsiroseomonas oryzae TaxID=2766473 RepID=UPI0022EB6532|nr:MipA/OmpV family protein [Roseomonas sp. MO-31]
MRFPKRSAAAALLSLALALPAAAQTGLAPGAVPDIPAPTTEWRIGLGAGVLASPDYLGSSSWRAIPVVTPELSWRDETLFLSFRDGLGATLLRSGGFRAGLVLRPRFGRDQDDNAALAGMGDIRISGEGGGFLSYGDGTWRGSVELRQGFGGFSGLVADARLDRVFRVRPDVFLSAGPRVSWGDSGFAQTFLGVDATQSARSGYQPFSPGNYWFAGLAGGVTWLAAERWTVAAFGEVGRILGDSADSPLVDRGSATQGVVGLAVSWRLAP